MQVTHPWPSCVYILPTIILSISYNLPKFWELRVGPESASDSLSDSLVSNSSDFLTATPVPSGSGNSYDTWQQNVSEQVNANNTFEPVFIFPTQLRLNPWYIKIYLIYINMITHGIIPIFTLTLLNMAIYKQVNPI